MLDFLGKELMVHDHVIFMAPYYKVLRFGRILKITPQTIRMLVVRSYDNRAVVRAVPLSNKTEVMVNVVRIEKDQCSEADELEQLYIDKILKKGK